MFNIYHFLCERLSKVTGAVTITAPSNNIGLNIIILTIKTTHDASILRCNPQTEPLEYLVNLIYNKQLNYKKSNVFILASYVIMRGELSCWVNAANRKCKHVW